MLKRYSDIIAGGGLMALCILLYVEAMQIESIAYMPVTADAMPKIVITIVFVLAFFVLLRGIRQMKATPKQAVTPQQAHLSRQKLFAVIFCLVSIFLAIALLEKAGFVLTMIAYLLCNFILLTPKEKRNYRNIIAIAVIAPVLVYVLFVKIFEILLPAGILSFLG